MTHSIQQKSTYTHLFTGHHPGKPGLAGCPLIFLLHSPKTVHPPGHTRSFHILSDTIPPCLPRTSPWFSSFHFYPVSIILTFHVSKPSQSNFLNHQTDCGSNPNSSLNSLFFFLSVKVNLHIHLIMFISTKINIQKITESTFTYSLLDLTSSTRQQVSIVQIKLWTRLTLVTLTDKQLLITNRFIAATLSLCPSTTHFSTVRFPAVVLSMLLTYLELIHKFHLTLRTTLWFKKNAPTLADYNYDPVQSILIIFSKLFVNDHKSCLVVKFSTSPHMCCHYTL